jgi:FkbM family methyltransferase
MGLINWDALWKFNLATAYRNKLGETNYWNNRAVRFNENTVLMEKLTNSQLERMPLLPENTVLEIGAGTGRLAIPMAKRVKHVTAVEPSPMMTSFLKSNSKKEKINNISTLNCSCEDLDTKNIINPHDIVVASFSLFMTDIKNALKKLDSLATKRAHLFLSASKWVNDELQEIIYGETLPFMCGDYIYVYNILHDLGILANVEIWDHQSLQSYDDLDTAVTQFMDNYRILSAKEDELRNYLRERLVVENGKLWLRRNRKVAMVWWTKQ